MSDAPANRVPGLDGLRAVSILLVLCAHMIGVRGFYNNPALWRHTGDWGNLGVRVFFVISGFIITLLLLREMEKTGTISIKQFYIRRVYRIFPASYSYIVVVTIALLLGILDLHRGDLLHAYTYTVNYSADRSWVVGHLWSLSVEEQFYLLWPATLLLLGKDKGLKVAVGVVLLGPAMRIGTFYFWASQRPLIGNSFQTVADAIATGCVLAGYKDQLLMQSWFRKIIDSSWFFVIPLAALALNIRGGARLRWALFETPINLLIALCVCRVTVHTKDWSGRVLNSTAFVFIGVLSYSLYVWQQLFLNRNSDAWPERFPQNLVLAFGAAIFSYYIIERPFLRMREAHRRVRIAPARAQEPSRKSPEPTIPTRVTSAAAATENTAP